MPVGVLRGVPALWLMGGILFLALCQLFLLQVLLVKDDAAGASSNNLINVFASFSGSRWKVRSEVISRSL